MADDRARRLRNLREQARQRQGGRCCWCESTMADADSGLPNACSTEHLIPRHAGGPDDARNIRAACVRCNQARKLRSKHRKNTSTTATVAEILAAGRTARTKPRRR